MTKRILFLVFASYCLCKADVPFVPYYDNEQDNSLLGNIETLGSYEIYFNKSNLSCLFWGGFAVVYPLLDNSKANYGYEYAIELRKHFLHKQNYNNFYGSIYLGNAIMKTPRFYQNTFTHYESSFGISYGIKFGYQYNILTLTRKPLLSLVLDPYFSLSGSHYSDNSGYWNTIEHPIFTLGIRLLLNVKSIIIGNQDHKINIEEVK
jgi:hypothetical protein